jgi:hypothetical protein
MLVVRTIAAVRQAAAHSCANTVARAELRALGRGFPFVAARELSR